MVKNLAMLGIIVTGLGLGGEYLIHGQMLLALCALGLGGLWGFGFRQGWDHLNTPAFVAAVSLAALGIYHGIAPLGLFLASLAALWAWDLSHFARSLDQAEEIEEETALHRVHLRRLFLVLLLGLLLGSAALFLQFNLSFGPVALLSLLLALSLSLVIRLIRPGV